VGDDEPVPLPERPWTKEVTAARTGREMLTRYAAMAADVGERVARVYEAVRVAADADPEVRKLWDSINAERRGGAATFVGMVAARARLRNEWEADREAAADVVFVFSDPGLYHLLVHRQGWAKEAFSDWLGRTLCSQLLASGPTPTPPRR